MTAPADAPAPARFSIFDGLALALWTVLAQILIFTPLAVLGFQPAAGAATLAVLLGVQVFTLAVALGWLRLRQRLTGRLLGRERPAWRHVGGGLLAGIVGFVLVRVVVVVAVRLFGPVPPPDQLVLQSVLQGGLAAVLTIIVSVVLAPLVEETVFRGVLFQAGRDTLGVLPGIALSAFAFAVVHTDVRQPLFSGALMLLGAWFAWIFHRSGSLLVPMTAHATYNAITVVAALQLAPA